MRIAFCHNLYQQRSGEDIAFDFAVRLLRDNGHHVSVYSASNSAIKSFTTTDKLLFPIRTVYSRGVRRLVRQFAVAEQSTVAIVQNVFPLLSPSVYYGLADAGLPIIQFVFNYRLLCSNGLLFTQNEICERCVRGNHIHGILRRCYRNSYALSATYAAALSVHRWAGTWRKLVSIFVTPDEFLANKLIEGGIDSDKIRVVSNPFDISGLTPKYDGGEYVLFVGRLIRAKGIFTLLEAASSLDGPRVIIVGDGEEAERVRSHPAVVDGKAEFIGPVYGSQFDELVRNSACVVVPSEWYDNLPMIVCQAFGAGKPVIASCINGIPEFVQHEKNGLLFTPGSANELRESIERLHRDPSLRRTLSLGARSTAETVLSPTLWQQNMNSVLQQALEGRVGRS
jgi:glycosyltransferase involved in cell wall biosynthesis